MGFLKTSFFLVMSILAFGNSFAVQKGASYEKSKNGGRLTKMKQAKEEKTSKTKSFTPTTSPASQKNPPSLRQKLKALKAKKAEERERSKSVSSAPVTNPNGNDRFAAYPYGIASHEMESSNSSWILLDTGVQAFSSTSTKASSQSNPLSFETVITVDKNGSAKASASNDLTDPFPTPNAPVPVSPFMPVPLTSVPVPTTIKPIMPVPLPTVPVPLSSAPIISVPVPPVVPGNAPVNPISCTVDGTQCDAATTCALCCAESSLWPSKGNVRACGKDICASSTSHSSLLLESKIQLNNLCGNNFCPGTASDGCSIPGGLPPINAFIPACNLHDICYACNHNANINNTQIKQKWDQYDKDKCDQMFLDKMNAMCHHQHSLNFFPDSVNPTLQTCLTFAQGYYAAVVLVGKDKFKMDKNKFVDFGCHWLPDDPQLNNVGDNLGFAPNYAGCEMEGNSGAYNGCWEDGRVCVPGVNCQNCCNTARTDLGWKCGGECWPDGEVCGVGTTCDFCCNSHSHWFGDAITKCGKEKCWEDGRVCGPGTTCRACCNTARTDLGWKCGGECWPDGERCGILTTCNYCCNGFHYKVPNWWHNCGP